MICGNIIFPSGDTRMSNDLRGFSSKKLLALVRNGDFAHPGEIDAIDLAFASIPLDRNRQLLDVGCGLGGTAKYVQDHGWGQITAIDIDQQCIDYAHKKYPDVTFHTHDALKITEILPEKKFDVIYLFNSFFAFADQLTALQQLHAVAKPNAQLIIFDYSDRTNQNNPLVNSTANKTFLPIKLDTIATLLQQANWQLTEIQDITKEYTIWYQDLLTHFAQQYHHIVSEFSEAEFNTAHQRYVELYDAIQQNILGGCIVYARR